MFNLIRNAFYFFIAPFLILALVVQNDIGVIKKKIRVNRIRKTIHSNH